MVMLTEGLLEQLRDQIELTGARVRWRPGLADSEIDAIIGSRGFITPDEVRTLYRYGDALSIYNNANNNIIGFYPLRLERAFADNIYDPWDLRIRALSLTYEHPRLWAMMPCRPGQPSEVYAQTIPNNGSDGLRVWWPSIGTMVTDILEALKFRRYNRSPPYGWVWKDGQAPDELPMWDEILTLPDLRWP